MQYLDLLTLQEYFPILERQFFYVFILIAITEFLEK